MHIRKQSEKNISQKIDYLSHSLFNTCSSSLESKVLESGWQGVNRFCEIFSSELKYGLHWAKVATGGIGFSQGSVRKYIFFWHMQILFALFNIISHFSHIVHYILHFCFPLTKSLQSIIIADYLQKSYALLAYMQKLSTALNTKLSTLALPPICPILLSPILQN